jgi:hypothetical protein
MSAMAKLTDAQARGALEVALERASRQLLEMPASEVVTDDGLGWMFDGPGRFWILVEGERLESTCDAVPVVLTAYLRSRFRARAVASRRVVVPLT